MSTYLGVLEAEGLSVVNKLPTRISSNKESLIDRIICRVLPDGCNVYNVFDDLSDHNLLIFDIPKISKDAKYSKIEKNIDIFDYELINNHYLAFPCDFQSDCPVECLERLTQLLHNGLMSGSKTVKRTMI